MEQNISSANTDANERNKTNNQPEYPTAGRYVRWRRVRANVEISVLSINEKIEDPFEYNERKLFTYYYVLTVVYQKE